MLTLLGKPVADAVLARVRERVKTFTGKHKRSPRLAVVLVGTDPASVIYTRKKGEGALALGMEHETINLPATTTPEEVKKVIEGLNADPLVDGILIQRPLPKGFIEEEVVYWVAPEKDVDAFHPLNAGKLVLGLPCFQPCTPTGVMEILKHYQFDPAGKTACVIGRSSIVGRPMASLLLQANATVLHCHSKTKNISDFTRQADILVVAAGKPQLIRGDHIRENAVVIDVGIHRTAEGKIVGDVDFDGASKKAAAITPVPRGVGPMTIAILLENTVMAAEIRSNPRN